MPFIDQGIIKKMIGGYNNTFDGVFIKDSKGQIEPLLAIFNPNIYSKLLRWYNSGNYSLNQFIKTLDDACYVAVNEDHLINLNTPAEFKDFNQKS